MSVDLRHMPPRAPLEMAPQRLNVAPSGVPRRAERGAGIWRLAVFVPALMGTGALLLGLQSWLAMGGMTWLEWALLALIGLSFVWVALSFTTVLVGTAGFLRPEQSANLDDAPSLHTALLVPIFNEVPWDVFGNAQAMLDDLARRAPRHRYTLFILSDTRDPSIAAQEETAFAVLQGNAPAGFAVHYRRRAQNTDKKVGNLTDWVTGWGAGYDAMLVLDADSLMSGATILALTDALAQDETAGLVQSLPLLIGADTVFARVQQFSAIAYGWLLAEGLALWSRSESNYWGHNAILRTRAFAASAGLPHLPGGRLILSHDFVEAGLLRRAGWRVRFLPRLTGSFEETPANLIDYVQRDRRWCRGNLQHLRLLWTRGLHPVSRFHLLSGAVSYLLAPAWFLLLLAWSLLGRDAEANVISYFREDSPLYPDWPEMTEINAALFLVIMYTVLLAPKLTGAVIILSQSRARRIFGGRGRFLAGFALELVLSILFAPILMIQQCRAVLRALLTRREPWSPQRRGASRVPLRRLLRFHWVETVLGLMLWAGLLSGLVTPWLLPIALSLALAVPLSALSAVRVTARAPAALRLDNPLTLRIPAIVRKAQRERNRLRAVIEGALTEPAE